MILTPKTDYKELDEWLKGKKKVFLVCGSSIRLLEELNKKLNMVGDKIIRFSDFSPNPTYESIVNGVNLFRKENCDSIMAIGGGSAIDVAKCIKRFSGQCSDGANGEWFTIDVTTNNLPFLVIPTTAGSGSEATRFAVIYYKGVKQSITDESFIPEIVLMDPSVLRSLPIYQKKATMCDALSHAIESFWSINSNDESKQYATEAIKGILENMNGYLNNSINGNSGMLKAAYRAGQAINISRTTAGHAMCYKITSLFNIPHGHAAFLCNRVLYPWMVDHLDECIDPRGRDYLGRTLDELGVVLGSTDSISGANSLEIIFNELMLDIPTATEAQYEDLKGSVNPERLLNFPVALNEQAIDELYHRILR